MNGTTGQPTNSVVQKLRGWWQTTTHQQRGGTHEKESQHTHVHNGNTSQTSVWHHPQPPLRTQAQPKQHPHVEVQARVGEGNGGGGGDTPPARQQECIKEHRAPHTKETPSGTASTPAARTRLVGGQNGVNKVWRNSAPQTLATNKNKTSCRGGETQKKCTGGEVTPWEEGGACVEGGCACVVCAATRTCTPHSHTRASTWYQCSSFPHPFQPAPHTPHFEWPGTFRPLPPPTPRPAGQQQRTKRGGERTRRHSAAWH